MAQLKVALLDTSFSAIPLIESLCLEKIELFVVGAKKNDFLCNLGQVNHIEMDYTNIKNLDAVLRDLSIERIIPGCNDVSFMSFLKLTNNYQFSEAKFDQINNKNSFRTLCRKLDIPSPKILENDKNLKNHKIIIKPELGFSGQGVTSFGKQSLTHQIDNAVAIAESFSRNKKAVIEEFIDGQLFSISIFVREFKPTRVFVVKEFCLENPYAVNWSYIDERFTDQIQNCLQDLLTELPRKLGMEKGLLHFQCIKDIKDKIYFIEATSRCPGDLYPYLIELQLGEHYSTFYLEQFIELDFIKVRPLRSSQFKIIRHTSSFYNRGTFIGFNHQNRKTILSVPTLNFGETNDEGNKYRSGVHFYATKSKAQFIDKMISNSERVHKQI